MSVAKMRRFCVAAVIFCLCFVGSSTYPHQEDAWTVHQGLGKCGYDSCNPVKDGMINVHLVPHTHDDVGWLKTVDQYYYGSRDDIAHAGVQYILDSLIPVLQSDPSKRFIYVEMAFFSRWWQQQSDSMRHTVKGLVNNGQLEFILGGWCMNDEASTHYNAIIDQHTLGFEFLRVNFGECGRPRVAWQIDPFGHSREQASLFAQMGFDGLYFGRLDYQDKSNRLHSKTMEMVWKGSPLNLGNVANLFTGALYNGYGPPSGFCFDTFCTSDPFMDDDRLHDYNVPEKVKDFLAAVKDQAQHYATNHIMMTMGSDFQYSNAHHWYKNLDKLIKYVNMQQKNGSKVNLLYSTPSCYTYQLNKAGKTWTTKDDDFFPYAHRAHSFWTGYYTSRPTLKYYVRNTNNFLQVVMQMDALAKLEDTDNSIYNIQILKQAMGVAQHHDAVSGTEKQAVAYDYAERLGNGVNECQKVVNDAYKKLLPIGKVAAPEQVFCTLLNISYCNTSELVEQFQVLIYNPIGRPVSQYVRLPVIGRAYNVTGPDGKPVTNDILQLSIDTMRIPERNGSLALYILLFRVQLPALGFSVYFAHRNDSTATKPTIKPNQWKPLSARKDVVLKNQFVSITFDGMSGFLRKMTNIKKNISVNLVQDYRYYVGHTGNNSKPEYQASGAYIFRPNGSGHDFPPVVSRVNSYLRQGTLVQEVYQQFTRMPWVTQVVRLYDDVPYVEFQWTVGPIPIDDGDGKEIISLFKTNLATNGTFYTDANGREILKRVRNQRKTWKLNQTEPIAGNYYPVNSRIFLQDKSKNIQLTVLTDRSQGGTSTHNGNIELMVHRRLLHDDSLGVNEPLNETGSDGFGLVVRGNHFVFLDTINASAALHRDMAEKLFMGPSVSFTTQKMNQAEWKQKFHTNWSGLKKNLPANVHLLTLEQFAGSGPVPAKRQPFLLRLEHFYEKNEDAKLSLPVTISLKDLFVPFQIASIEELTLGANLPLAQLKRLKWNTKEGTASYKDTTLRFQPKSMADPLSVTLNPMEIKTFQVNLVQ